MRAVFVHSLRRFRSQIIGWGLALAAYGGFILTFWDSVMAQKEKFEELYRSYPPEFLAFFGDGSSIFTPEGYLTMYCFSMLPVIVGIFAVAAASGLLAGEEEAGRLDLVLAHPVSRTGLFLGRTLALITATAGILTIAWAGFTIAMTWSSFEVGTAQLALPFVSLFAVLLVFGMLALALSMVLPSRRAAAAGGGLILVASYLITSLARIDATLEAVATLSPLAYYEGGQAIGGLNLGWLVGMLGGAALLGLVAWWRFERRDIRVSGEGSWRLLSRAV